MDIQCGRHGKTVIWMTAEAELKNDRRTSQNYSQDETHVWMAEFVPTCSNKFPLQLGNVALYAARHCAGWDTYIRLWWARAACSGWASFRNKPWTLHSFAHLRNFNCWTQTSIELLNWAVAKTPMSFSSNPTCLPRGRPHCFRDHSFSFRGWLVSWFCFRRASAKRSSSWNRLPQPARFCGRGFHFRKPNLVSSPYIIIYI